VWCTGLVCSCIETEAAPPESLFDEIEGLDSIHIEWKDMGVPRKDLIDNLLAKMHEYVSTGRPAVVHCFAGKGTTAILHFLVPYEHLLPC
jgi:protein-tyrosine phosphatase